MAQAAHMSERTFRRAFEAETGQAPKPFYDRIRLSVADELLRQKAYNIIEVAFHLGFSSAGHFSKAFRRHFGRFSVTPDPPRPGLLICYYFTSVMSHV